jgi:hypothetical protein
MIVGLVETYPQVFHNRYFQITLLILLFSLHALIMFGIEKSTSFKKGDKNDKN